MMLSFSSDSSCIGGSEGLYFHYHRRPKVERGGRILSRGVRHSTDGHGPDGSENQEVFWSPSACLTFISKENCKYGEPDESTSGPVPRKYTVQPGDTLSKISERYYGHPERLSLP